MSEMRWFRRRRNRRLDRFWPQCAAAFFLAACAGMATAALLRPRPRPVQAHVRACIRYNDASARSVTANVSLGSDIQKKKIFTVPAGDGVLKTLPAGPIALVVQPLTAAGQPDGEPFATTVRWPARERETVILEVPRDQPAPRRRDGRKGRE